MPPEAIGDALADAYNALHDEELSLFPDAHQTLDRLKEVGLKLALITNGAAEPQRAKVVRFALEHRFDVGNRYADLADLAARAGRGNLRAGSGGAPSQTAKGVHARFLLVWLRPSL